MPATLREEPFCGPSGRENFPGREECRRRSERRQKGPIRHRTGLKKLRHSHDSNSSVPSAKIVPFPRKNNRDPNCSDRDFNFYARKEQTAIRQRRKRDDVVGGGGGIIGPIRDPSREKTGRCGRGGTSGEGQSGRNNRGGTGGEGTVGKGQVEKGRSGRAGREGTGGEGTIGKGRPLYSPVSRSDRHTARPESRTRAWHAKSPPRAAGP